MSISLIPNSLFYVKNKDTYPPFKNGLYMEEYFLEYMKKKNLKYDKSGRLYLPILWTNFQIEDWFQSQKDFMQTILDKYIEENKCSNGYFTVVQMDDGPLLKLPENTMVYGACNGNIYLPLIYQDINNTLVNYPKKSFSEKNIFASFVGCLTHDVRKYIVHILNNNKNFKLMIKNDWSPDVNKTHQDNFIENTINSKFTLAPRGYGRSSFRFFEVFQLGSIPIYVWDDIEWLPYKDIIDYSKICISIHVSEMHKLEEILLNIDEIKYNQMLDEYHKIKHIFELEFMCEYVVTK